MGALLWSLLLLAPPAFAQAAGGPWYADPGLALAAGEQSRLDPRQGADALKEAGVSGKDPLKDAARIHRWLAENFKSRAAGGAFIGKSTASSLLASRELTGCHDWALLLSALLRSAGTPALMADAAGEQWMAAARAGLPLQGFSGHVFVEAFAGGRWVLLDPVSGRYLADYDPGNPSIPMEAGDQTSYRVMFKGLDPAGYGLRGVEDLNARMLRFARDEDASRPGAPNGRVLNLPGEPPPPSMSDEVLTGPCPLDPSRRGIVLQFPGAGLDAHAEKSGALYLAHLYPYGRVFSGEARTVSFPTAAELKRYLRDLEPPR